MITGLGTHRTWNRYIPAIPAGLTVMAAGWGFQRVFTWGDTAAPVVIATLLGAGAGVAARRILTGSANSLQDGGPSADSGRPDRERLAPDSPAFEGPSGPAPGFKPAPLTDYLLAGGALVAAVLVSVAVTAAAFASPGAGSVGRALARGVGALGGGWSRILTTSVPVPPTPDRLPLAAGLVTMAAAWAVLSATRRQPGVDALLPAGLVLLAALLLGVHGPGSLAVVAGPPLVLAAGYLLVVSHPPGEGGVWVAPGRTAAAISTGAIVLVIALAAGTDLPLATLRQPVNLRNSLSPPVDLASTANPLDLLPAWQRESKTVMFTAAVDPAWLAAPANWQLVSLDAYDGTGWSTDAKATKAGDRLSLPSGLSAATLGPEVRVKVSGRALTGPWVPTAGVPTAVTPADLDFDPGSSDLVAPAGITGPFTLTGRLLEPSRSELDGAAVGGGAAAAALTAVPACFPASLRSLAARATGDLDRPDQQAVAVEQQLATKGDFSLDPGATPGSSCARLSAFASSKSGTAEQFATAFALMARTIGLPSRVVVGFTPGAIDGSSHQTTVTGSDAAVWPEVDLGGLGWVSFDPAPSLPSRGQGRTGARATTTVPVAQQGLNQVRQTVAAGPPRSVPGTNPAGPPARRRTGAASGLQWLLVVGLVLTVALAGLLTARSWTRRRRRAQRRAAPDPVGKVLGAWSEVLDSMALLRVPAASLTPSEVYETVAYLVPPAGEASRHLAGLVDQAVYAGVADDATAAAAWVASDSAVKALVAAVPTGRRIRVRLVGSARVTGG
jgi:transglutaminase-like putative cysteine protease